MYSDMNAQKQRGEWSERDDIDGHSYSDEVECEPLQRAPVEERVESETQGEPAVTEVTEVVVVETREVNMNVPAEKPRDVNGPQESFDHNTGVSSKTTEVSKTESLPGWLMDEARDDARKSAVDSSTTISKVLTDPLVMPGTRREAERDIANVGPEGVPGDAKDGPTLLRLEIVGLTVLLLGIALGVGVWFGWIYGAVIAGWAMLSLLFNPVVWATLSRAKDRSIAANMENQRRTVVKH